MDTHIFAVQEEVGVQTYSLRLQYLPDSSNMCFIRPIRQLFLASKSRSKEGNGRAVVNEFNQFSEVGWPDPVTPRCTVSLPREGAGDR